MLNKFVKDICSMECRTKSEVRRLAEKFRSDLVDEAVKKVGENITATRAFPEAEENTMDWVNGYNKCHQTTIDNLSKLK